MRRRYSRVGVPRASHPGSSRTRPLQASACPLARPRDRRGSTLPGAGKLHPDHSHTAKASLLVVRASISTTLLRSRHAATQPLETPSILRLRGGGSRDSFRPEASTTSVATEVCEMTGRTMDGAARSFRDDKRLARPDIATLSIDLDASLTVNPDE